MKRVVTLALALGPALSACRGETAAPTSPGPATALEDAGPLGDPHVDGAASRGACPVVQPARVVGTMQNAAITEASGLAASRKNPGVLWTHNDSGDSARLFAVKTDGAALAELSVPGASAVDWEDLALGPDGALYAGDIGDNDAVRPTVVVYRVPEPALDASAPRATLVASSVEALTLRYPDGPRDAEALLVDPSSGDLYLVSKTLTGASVVYRAPAGARGEVTLERVAQLQLGLGGLVTAGDISPRGDWIALRSYGQLFLWRRAPGDTVAGALGKAPCITALSGEKQGEALAFSASGDGLYSTTEGDHPAIRFLALPAP